MFLKIKNIKFVYTACYKCFVIKENNLIAETLQTEFNSLRNRFSQFLDKKIQNLVKFK